MRGEHFNKYFWQKSGRYPISVPLRQFLRHRSDSQPFDVDERQHCRGRKTRGWRTHRGFTSFYIFPSPNERMNERRLCDATLFRYIFIPRTAHPNTTMFRCLNAGNVIKKNVDSWMKRKYVLRAKHLIRIRFFDFPFGIHTHILALQLEHSILRIIWRIHLPLSAERKVESRRPHASHDSWIKFALWIIYLPKSSDLAVANRSVLHAYHMAKVRAIRAHICERTFSVPRRMGTSNECACTFSFTIEHKAHRIDISLHYTLIH